MEADPANPLLFIDVDAKAPIPIVKEENHSSSEENQNDQKNDEPGRLRCGECDRFTCQTPDRMTRHIRKVHRGQNPYQCSMCGYSTYNSVCFREHVNIHQGIKPYQCSHCPYRSVSKKYIKKHETKHSSCEKCGFIARNRRALKSHQKAAGCKTVDQDFPYKCLDCDISYENKSSLKMHEKLHRKCELCDKSFSYSVLIKHQEEVHGLPISYLKSGKNNVVTKFRCKLCSWNSNCLRSILLHLIHHPNQEIPSSIDVSPLVQAGIL